MKYFKFKFIAIILSIVFLISVPGVFAVWTYASGEIDPVIITNSVTLGEFDYNVPTKPAGGLFEDALNDAMQYSDIKDAFVSSGQSVISSESGVGKDLINSIFGSNPKIEIDGQTVQVDTILIQRANVDGQNTGADGANEYTIYLVAGSTVYAMTYNAESEGGWDQIGHTYAGTMSEQDINNLNVGGWKATPATYKVGDYEYKVGQSSGNHIDRLITLEELMSASDDYLVNSINNKNPTNLSKAYILLAKEYVVDSTLSNNDMQAMANAFKGLKRYVRYIIESHRVEIQLNNGASRAEILSYLITIYEVMYNYEGAYEIENGGAEVPYATWRNNYNMSTFYNAEWSKW